jgi:hypothetical protein
MGKVTVVTGSISWPLWTADASPTEIGFLAADIPLSFPYTKYGLGDPVIEKFHALKIEIRPRRFFQTYHPPVLRAKIY